MFFCLNICLNMSGGDIFMNIYTIWPEVCWHPKKEGKKTAGIFNSKTMGTRCYQIRVVTESRERKEGWSKKKRKVNDLWKIARALWKQRKDQGDRDRDMPLKKMTMWAQKETDGCEETRHKSRAREEDRNPYRSRKTSREMSVSLTSATVIFTLYQCCSDLCCRQTAAIRHGSHPRDIKDGL